MAEWYEVYEDEATRRAAELRARRLVIGYALASSAVVALAPVAALAWRPHSLWVAIAALVLLVGHGVWLGVQLVRLRRAVWRLDLSVHHIVGHDVSGRRRVLGWADVTYVDLADGGIEMMGRRMGRRVQFVVPAEFPDHGHIGHRVVRYAEAFGRPVFVDGRAVEALDIASLLPGTEAPVRATGRR